MKSKYILTLVYGLILLSTLISCNSQPGNSSPLPNIVLIMCDDLGYSDLGSFGGEIRTPHIDQLAQQGLRFTNFTNTSRCCPSRAALLTGRYQHTVGMGWMTAVDEHRPGYRGQLTNDVPTLAEILKQNGYSTYMSGKWHVTLDGNYRNMEKPVPNGSWPTQRGFDEYYGGLSGGGRYDIVKSLMRNETHITEFADDYYYTTAITEHALKFIEMHDTRKPFFLYLAHYAPHRPLQAPEERIATYREQYSVGYDVLRQARFNKLQELGIIPSDAKFPTLAADFGGNYPAWDSLSAEQQAAWVEEMATYAAMVEIMDDGIGEVVESLKTRGMYDNTLILFMSDNGATKEGGEVSQWAAALSNTPYRQYKQFTHLGGIKSPLIVHFPQRFPAKKGSLQTELSHLMDILPTCLEVAGIDYPETFRDKPLSPIHGMSLLPVIEGAKLPQRDLFFEHQTSSAMISGKWKLVRLSSESPWELYDLSIDPFEQCDLSKSRPDKTRQMVSQWTQWAEENQVFPLEPLPWRKRIQHYERLYPDQDGID